VHPFTKSEIDKITSLALEAGEIAANAFKDNSFETYIKDDGSKVTSCDLFLSEFFKENLSKIFNYPIICEEGDLREIAGDDFFLIDPIDGTSSFAEGRDQFCINIAFIQNKKPVFGLINAPLFEGGKMVFCDENNDVISYKNASDQSILNADNYSTDQLRIISSIKSKESDIQNYIAKNYPDLGDDFSLKRMSSAVKFIKLIEGDVNLQLHFRPSMEWDIAPGQALIEIMGGRVRTLHSSNGEHNIALDMEYKKDGFRNGPFVAYFKESFQK
jgi:3'(2'), 5'-bisphosphate nucleotidase